MIKKILLVILALLVLLSGWVAWKMHQPPVRFQEPERVVMPPRWENTVTHAPVKIKLRGHHYEVEVEYIKGWPIKGETFDLVVAWPSLVSGVESSVLARTTHGKEFSGLVKDLLDIRISPIGPSGFHEMYETTYMNREETSDKIGKGDWPITKVDALGLFKMVAPCCEYYWPIDSSIRTPFQNNPYMFDCNIGSDEDARLTCLASYQINQELSVRVGFSKTHLRDWKTIFFDTQKFIKSIEKRAA